MDPTQVKLVAWYLSLGAGAVALLAAVISGFGPRERAFGWARAAALSLVGGVLMAAIALVVLFTLAPGSGARGVAAAFALGAVIGPLATLVTALRHPIADASAGSVEAPAPILLPGIVMLGAAVLAMGMLANHYGIRANAQWMGLILGLSSGLIWSVLSVRAMTPRPYADWVTGMLIGAGLTAIALPATAVLAGAHFAQPSTAPWFAIFCGAGVLAGWTLTLVAVVLVSRGVGSSLATVSGAIVMCVALGSAAWSAQANIVHEDRLLPVLAVGLLAALLVLAVSASVPPAETPEGRRDADPVAALCVAFVVLAVAWVGFKVWLGLGIVVAALGFLSAFPVAAALGASSPAGPLVAERAAALGGAGLLLLGCMKLYQQEANLMLSGIDIADGNVTVALLAGLILPVLVEPLMGRRPGTQATGSPIPGAISVLGRFLGCAVVVGAAVVGGALYFNVDGIAAILVGLSAWAVLSAAAFVAQGEENGLLAFRGVFLATAVVGLAVLLLPYKDQLAIVTRAQKMQVLAAVTLVAALAMMLAATLSRRAAGPTRPVAPPKPAATPEPETVSS